MLNGAKSSVKEVEGPEPLTLGLRPRARRDGVSRGRAWGQQAGGEQRNKGRAGPLVCCDHEAHVPADPTGALYGTATRGPGLSRAPAHARCCFSDELQDKYDQQDYHQHGYHQVKRTPAHPPPPSLAQRLTVR